ncbi:hypothetical protein [Romboutsia sp. 1001713B170131_170501_G6]|uniref:hypothetical protein n=1 Tax=Romboutsia sp. 1001713B170131_170501_G6 TaxID=2787108 RepID=UPI0018AAAE7D|nr:hypothetical protein [Romboutsia sp. 1001713B170131_170501_G6]
MKNTITDSLVICGIGLIVISIWQMLEMIIIGEIIPSKVDSIVSIILMFSLYGNYCSYIKNK